MGDKQLDWIPVYIDKLLGSRRWHKMKDYQRGWYWQLLIESVRSEKPGYLRLESNLWATAGACSKQYWESPIDKSGIARYAAVLACFSQVEIDGGRWIYNERLVRTLLEQNAKLNKGLRRKTDKTDVDLSLSISEVAVAVEVRKEKSNIEEIYKAYPRHVGKRTALKAINNALTRLLAGKESELELFASTDDAIVYLLGRTRLFASTPAGQAGEYTAHAATWFNRSSYLDDESEWSKRGEQNQEASKRPADVRLYAATERIIPEESDTCADCLATDIRLCARHAAAVVDRRVRAAAAGGDD